LAYELLNSKFSRYLLSNCESVWGDQPEDIKKTDAGTIDTCVILDEGGLFLKTSQDAQEFMVGLRKLNVVLIIPSVEPPTSRMKFVTVQRVVNLRQIVGLDFWLYKYLLKKGFDRETGYFGWFKPSEIYGIYNTLDLPVDDNGISDYLISVVQEKTGKAHPSVEVKTSEVIRSSDQAISKFQLWKQASTSIGWRKSANKSSYPYLRPDVKPEGVKPYALGYIALFVVVLVLWVRSMLNPMGPRPMNEIDKSAMQISTLQPSNVTPTPYLQLDMPK
jgi:hypothetical protein